MQLDQSSLRLWGKLALASLEDVIASKKAAGRPRDLAVLTVLEVALDES